MTSIWSEISGKISSFFSNAEVTVSSDLEKILDSPAAHTFVTGLEAGLKSTVGTIARDAVAAAEKAGGTPVAMAEAAVASIIADAATKGIPLVESEARLFMEIAVSELKGLFSAEPPVAAPATPKPPAAS